MQKTISGLVKVIVIKAIGTEAFVKESCLDQTARLLLKKILAMPIWLKFPIVTLTFLYKVLGGTVEGWQNSGIKVCREFIKFYEKLALFIYFSL